MQTRANGWRVVLKTAWITIILFSAVGCGHQFAPKNHALTVKCGSQNVKVDKKGKITPNAVVLLCEDGQVEWDAADGSSTFTVTFDRSPFKNGKTSFTASNGKAGPCFPSAAPNCGANALVGDEDDTINDIYRYTIAPSLQSSQGASDPHVIIIPGSR